MILFLMRPKNPTFSVFFLAGADAMLEPEDARCGELEEKLEGVEVTVTEGVGAGECAGGVGLEGRGGGEVAAEAWLGREPTVAAKLPASEGSEKQKPPTQSESSRVWKKELAAVYWKLGYHSCSKTTSHDEKSTMRT